MVRAGYAVALMLVVSFVASASAPQEKKRKVFTNEDVEQSAPSAPAAVVTPEKGTGAESKEAAIAPATATGPQAELKKAKEFQAVLKQNLEEVVAKVDKEPDMFRKERWTRVADCLNTLLQDNQRTISELEESSK